MIPSATYRGLSFNNNPNFIITGVSGLSNPTIRSESFDLPQADYGVYVEPFYGSRGFTVSGMIIGSTVEDFVARRDAFASAFSIYGGEQPFQFNLPGLTKTIDAVAADEIRFDPTTETPTACSFTAPMRASYPFLLGGSGQTITLGVPVTGGVTIPATVPLTLSGNSGGSAFAINGGNAPARPTARIYGPITNPALRNLTAGLDVLFDLSLLAGEWIDIDFRRHTVDDFQGRNRYGSYSGRWWVLGVGASEIRLVATASAAGAHADLTYAPTYLSL